MHGPIPMTAPFQTASTDKSSCTGMVKATLAAKKMRIIQQVMRFVCRTQTWCASFHIAKDMPAMKQPHKCVPQKCVIWA